MFYEWKRDGELVYLNNKQDVSSLQAKPEFIKDEELKDGDEMKGGKKGRKSKSSRGKKSDKI